MSFGDPFHEAAAAIASADALVICAGAGMGVDSGLPDFRGDRGFWKAYPPYAALGLSFVDLANPRWFRTDPELAWGFYGHRLALYRATAPHAGFSILHQWAGRAARGAFVFTSNVDGQFQRAGFVGERVLECHGSFARFQCVSGCGTALFPAPAGEVTIDPATFRASPPLPSCPGCGGLARPNILMFGDGAWDPSAVATQERRFATWLEELATAHARVVIVECGAGSAIPTVRLTSETLAGRFGAPLIRINPREPQGPEGTISMAGGAAASLAAIDVRI